MKTCHPRPGKPGFVSYVLVLSTAAILTLMMLYAYREAMRAQSNQSTVQLQLDYGEKEAAIMRSIVAITPNRAIRAMQHNSSVSGPARDALRWENILTESLDLANARTSIAPNVKTSLNIPNLRVANMGDSALGTPGSIFKALNSEPGFVSMGVNRSLGSGYPAPLSTSNSTTTTRDPIYPIITDDKQYGSLAQSFLSNAVLNGNGANAYGVDVGFFAATDRRRLFNRLRYPNINFGYSKPGDPFVAKRNWWALSANVADHDKTSTNLNRAARSLVLSIYEIPSQLAISASSFMSLGQYASGEAWQNVNIAGGIFTGKAAVEGSTAIPALASRRGMTLSSNSTVGGQSFANTPFTPGVRETYQLTQGDFFPVSQSSESGRVAFVPINRGAEFFDRFHPNVRSTESNVLSPTTWNNYSVGALQCAMRLDVTQVVSATDKTPTEYKFSYFRGGVRRTDTISLTTATSGTTQDLPPGYILACGENQSYNFGTAVVDVAYGLSGAWAFQTGVTGSITFNNARFGDPLVGTVKSGYFKPSFPFENSVLSSNNKPCIAVYPQRFKNFLTALNANGTDVNHSLAVNIDYTNIGPTYPKAPLITYTDAEDATQYGLILKECADLTSFTRGFSVVTNLRTYIGDDFNIVRYKNAVPAIAPPAGYSGTADTYYPPCSLFTPERRYGVDVDPYAVSLSGQIGSLAAEDAANPIRPMDSKTMSGNNLAASRIAVNLRPINHPADLPPITMMNWLVVLEERRRIAESGY
jgi:hypothetical protein